MDRIVGSPSNFSLLVGISLKDNFLQREEVALSLEKSIEI